MMALLVERQAHMPLKEFQGSLLVAITIERIDRAQVFLYTIYSQTS